MDKLLWINRGSKLSLHYLPITSIKSYGNRFTHKNLTYRPLYMFPTSLHNSHPRRRHVYSDPQEVYFDLDRPRYKTNGSSAGNVTNCEKDETG